MQIIRSFIVLCSWITISSGYHDNRQYQLKAFLGSGYQMPPSCGDYFKNSNVNFQVNTSEAFTSFDNYEINLVALYLKPLSEQAQSRLDLMSYEDFEQEARSSFRSPHEILNLYALYDHPYFKEFVKRSCERTKTTSQLRSIKTRYCIEREFHEQAEQLSFNLFEAADDLLSEIGVSHPSEIEDFYHEYKQFSYDESSHADRYKKRCDALTQRYEKTRKKSWLHPLTERLLSENSVEISKFKKFKGNAFQVQLYEEFVEILDQTSKLTSCHSHIRPYIPDLVHLVDIGQSFNREGCLIKAATIADYCWSFITAVCQGVALGTSHLADFIVHPVDSTIELIANTNSIAYYLGRAFYRIAEISSLASLQHIEMQYEGNGEGKAGIGLILGNKEANQRIRVFNNNCSRMCRILCEQYKDLSWHDTIKYVVAAGTEAFLTKKCAKVLHNITSKVTQQAAHIIKAIDNKIVTAETALISSDAAMLQIVGQSTSVAHDLAEGRLLLPAPINKAKTALTQVSEYVAELHETIPHLKNKFDGTIISWGEHTLSAFIDYEHLFMFEIKKNFQKKTKQYKPRLNGFHHDYLGKLEQSGMVRYANVKEILYGTYKTDVIINGVIFENKTFFPQSWSREKVIEKIFESLQNLTEIPLLQKDSIYKVIGKTKDNISIESIIDVYNNKIITTYPAIPK